MAETYSNGGTAVVGTGGISSGATTLPVTSQAGLPATGSFRILVGTEIMQVTSGGQSSSSWTVVRGTEGTSAVAHLAGVAITQPLTAAGLVAGLAGAAAGAMTNPMTSAGDLIVGGSSGAPARLARGADAQVLQMSGTSVSWQTPASSGGGGSNIGPIGTLVPPVEASFAWFGDDGSVLHTDTTLTGCTLLRDYNWYDAADRVRGRAITATAGGWQWTVGLKIFPPVGKIGQVVEGGLFYSNGTKVVTWGVRWAAGVHTLVLGHWDATDTRTSGYSPIVLPAPVGSPIFLQTQVLATSSEEYRVSMDNSFWTTAIIESGRETWMPASTITQYGYYFNYVNKNSLGDDGGCGAAIIHALKQSN